MMKDENSGEGGEAGLSDEEKTTLENPIDNKIDALVIQREMNNEFSIGTVQN